MQAELIGLRRTETVTTRFDRTDTAASTLDADRAAANDLEEFAELGGLDLLSVPACGGQRSSVTSSPTPGRPLKRHDAVAAT